MHFAKYKFYQNLKVQSDWEMVFHEVPSVLFSMYKSMQLTCIMIISQMYKTGLVFRGLKNCQMPSSFLKLIIEVVKSVIV